MARLAKPLSWRTRDRVTRVTVCDCPTTQPARGNKSALLQSYWSRSSQPDVLVAQASLEYGPVALWLIVITTLELIVLDGALVAHHRTLWSVVALAVTLFSAWSTYWAWQCLRWARHNEAIGRRFS